MYVNPKTEEPIQIGAAIQLPENLRPYRTAPAAPRPAQDDCGKVTAFEFHKVRAALLKDARRLKRAGGITPSCKALLQELIAEWMRENWRGLWPSHATLARALDCSIRTIPRCLARLESAGLIRRIGYLPNRYSSTDRADQCGRHSVVYALAWMDGYYRHAGIRACVAPDQAENFISTERSGKARKPACRPAERTVIRRIWGDTLHPHRRAERTEAAMLWYDLFTAA